MAQLFPAPDWPNTKLSGLKRSPMGPDLMESMVPGSRSTSTALGTYLDRTFIGFLVAETKS